MPLKLRTSQSNELEWSEVDSNFVYLDNLLNQNINDIDTLQESHELIIVDDNYTIIEGQKYIGVDTSVQSVLCLLPDTSNLDDGYTVTFFQSKGRFDQNALILGRNSANIMGLPENMIVNIPYLRFSLTKIGDNWVL